jgi:DNA-binding NtrC family response regulator
MNYRDAVAAAKRDILRRAVLDVGGNRSVAARQLGLDRGYFLKLVKHLGVDLPSPLRGGRPRGSKKAAVMG